MWKLLCGRSDPRNFNGLSALNLRGQGAFPVAGVRAAGEYHLAMALNAVSV